MTYRKRKGKAPKSPYTDASKIQVVTAFLTLGKVPLVEALTGVPRSTIKLWKTQPWWGEMVKEIQSEENQEVDSRLSKIINKTMDVIDDRLENGEWILDSRQGKAIRVPVKLKDASSTARDLFKQRDAIRNAPVAREKEEAQADRLLKLAEQFAEFAKAIKPPQREKEITGRVIEDAVYEERNERLSDGIQKIPLSTGADQEPVNEELSSVGV